MKESRYEARWQKIIARVLHNIAENKFVHTPWNRDKKFYVIGGERLHYQLKSFNRISDCFIYMDYLLSKLDPEFDDYYLSVWQRHNDGTVSRVCYTENYSD